MAIRAVVFDIGGILEIVPDGGDPTTAFPDTTSRHTVVEWSAAGRRVRRGLHTHAGLASRWQVEGPAWETMPAEQPG
jgi:hypothetical protein